MCPPPKRKTIREAPGASSQATPEALQIGADDAELRSRGRSQVKAPATPAPDRVALQIPKKGTGVNVP